MKKFMVVAILEDVFVDDIKADVDDFVIRACDTIDFCFDGYTNATRDEIDHTFGDLLEGKHYKKNDSEYTMVAVTFIVECVDDEIDPDFDFDKLADKIKEDIADLADQDEDYGITNVVVSEL